MWVNESTWIFFTENNRYSQKWCNHLFNVFYFLVKPGVCPKVRLECPPTRAGFRPPTQCPHDGFCPGTEKCCFDRCLGHHTCKAVDIIIIDYWLKTKVW